MCTLYRCHRCSWQIYRILSWHKTQQQKTTKQTCRESIPKQCAVMTDTYTVSGGQQNLLSILKLLHACVDASHNRHLTWPSLALFQRRTAHKSHEQQLPWSARLRHLSSFQYAATAHPVLKRSRYGIVQHVHIRQAKARGQRCSELVRRGARTGVLIRPRLIRTHC